MINKLIIFSLTFIISYNLKLKKFSPKIGIPIDNNKISETMSDLALKKLYYNLIAFNETSCRITAKFILLTIGGIENLNETKTLNLTNDYKTDLNNIRNLINKNYIIQIELRLNHHFIIFKKNSKELYLLHSFQDLFTLRDWMSNEKIMKPYLTIDDFINKMEIILNPNSTKKEINKNLIKLLMPPFFISDSKKIKQLINWFRLSDIKIVNVNYTPFDFKQNKIWYNFVNDFYNVDKNYDIKTDKYDIIKDDILVNAMKLIPDKIKKNIKNNKN